ncbi:MAG TPA: DNA topoisomerase IV subunit B [Candidatus Binatia bacterium]|jgi:DNA gyrase subunit B/topoisomerase-4 subunit B|nr:DNA topoisomerase IV subunit B [Candidatus Binatia bacterium]
MAATYTAKDILVLEGLEPVRRRPGMYIGGVDATGLHHLLWEIVDNSVDEAMNGHADKIVVTLHADGSSVTVADNGRGIPVDRHAQYRKSALELILTTLHAGGKFEAKNYYHSGGLHGVGASVVTALSEELVARVRRDGAEWEQRFARGKPTSGLEKLGRARGSGTTIFFRPDPKIFPSVRFDAKEIAERLEAKAYLHGGLTVEFHDERAGTKAVYRYDEGLKAFLAKLVGASKPLGGEVFTIVKQQDGLHLECALAWTEDTTERVYSYVNSIPTTAGGAHENGLKAGLVKAVRNYLAVHSLVPRGLSITAEDAREGLVAVLAIKLPQPQFQGQTKERLNNAELTPAIDGIVRTALENALNANRTAGDAIATRVVLAARARSASRAAAEQVQRKSAVSHRLNLPGKLADCSSTDPTECELFIVEGDSAGGSAKQGRERSFQAILPLRGKVLNSEQASTAKVLTNKELSDIVSALGCGTGKDFDARKLRYHKICLLMDADSDGNHICTLLLTFFYRHLPELIRQGYVYIAQPPLYRIEAGKDVYWARDDAEKDRLLAGRNGHSGRVQVTRFKGLGEMNPKTLKETTLDPARRSLLRVAIRDVAKTERAIQTLMGRDVAPRFEFIMERAPKVNEVDV